MDTEKAFDATAFRHALGHFATGVTIITAADKNEGCVGVTANSFNSVSLNPPLILWSLNRNSGTLSTYENSDYFIVNILADDQIELSNHFARPGVENKFADLNCDTGVGSIPLIPDCAAYFQCQKRFTYEGGDHLIFVGEVVDFQTTDRSGLLYHQGQYAVSERHPAAKADSAETTSKSFVQDYLDYLLSQTANAFEKQFQAELDKQKVSRFEWRILSCVSEYVAVDYEELSTLTLVDRTKLEEIVSEMQNKGWIRIESDHVKAVKLFVEETGMNKLIPLMAAATAHEASVMVDYSAAERRQLKDMLRNMLRRINEPLFKVVESGSS
ncbi:MAG: flavin oxidoreductase [Gammaproteobacteria bacterium]|nr:flavin oxidoreductase [Gammaproteobacteria bacterium]